MKKINAILVKVEIYFTASLLAILSTVVFIAAVTRKFGYPINWSQEFSLLLFAWLTFIGGDLLMRSDSLIAIDMFYNLFPKIVRTILSIIFEIGMAYFLIVLIFYGFKLVSQSWTRMFTTLKLSYAWATLCVPVGSTLMLTTVIKNLYINIRSLISKEVEI